MGEFLELLRNKINQITEFINRIQIIIGLRNATDDSIYGKINRIESAVNNIKIPKYYTETTVLVNDKFPCTYEPMNSMCRDDEVTLYHPDGSTLVWEGIKFIDNEGTLEDAGAVYNGWKVKVQYFYL